jgi:hypothetical protein
LDDWPLLIDQMIKSFRAILKFFGLPIFLGGGGDQKDFVTNCGDQKWATKNFWLSTMAIKSWQPNLLFQSP